MLAFAHTMLAPFMALALAYLGFLVVMGLRAATLRDVLLVRLLKALADIVASSRSWTRLAHVSDTRLELAGYAVS